MIKLTAKKPEEYSGDLVAFFVRQPGKGVPKCSYPGISQIIEPAFKAGDFLGKEGQTLLHYPGNQTGLKAKRVLIVGLGKDDLCRETFRKAGGTAVGVAMKTRAGKILAVVPESEDFDLAEITECLAEGLGLGAYQFRKYMKPDPEDDAPGSIKEIAVYAKDRKAVQNGLEKGKIAALAGCAVRDMANEPGNVWTPDAFADFGLRLQKEYGLKCQILNKNDMKRLKMGGVLGVNSGSDQPPKMVIVEYRCGKKKAPTIMLVGKGLTFDSGGISIKPSLGMQDMKYDMCGGAAVLGAMQAIGEERPKGVNVIAIVPSTENLPGPAALKPGDIITIYGGKTVEIQNTDAEGRLILADALAYGIEKYKPDAVLDLATLTGAVVVGLGHHRTGLMSNNDELAEKILAAGERSGEPLWRLPLGKEYSKQIKSKVADIKNVGDRAAGAITAAAFLQEFVGETTWAHLDIAGTAWGFTEKSYVPKGPSGIGARTLLELVRNWK